MGLRREVDVVHPGYRDAFLGRYHNRQPQDNPDTAKGSPVENLGDASKQDDKADGDVYQTISVIKVSLAFDSFQMSIL